MLNTTLKDGLGYEGKVTLTLKNNNHIIKSKTYKNNGTVHLFKFLGDCLAGRYTTTMLPSKILLLYTENEQDIDQRSTWQGLTQLPTIISDSTSHQVKVIYNFEVAKTAITGDFNMVALYGAGIEDINIKDYSAYYYLTDDSGLRETQDISGWSSTTILLIEWELTLSNRNTVS